MAKCNIGVDYHKKFSSAVLESYRNWCVMHDWVEDTVDEVVLANQYKVKAIAEAKIKADKIDATVKVAELRFECDHLRKCMNWNKAKVAMVRKLLTIAYNCVKEKRKYKSLNRIELERKILSGAS